MRQVTDFESLCAWAISRATRNMLLYIYIGKDIRSCDIMVFVGGKYAIIKDDVWICDTQQIIEETIRLAEEEYR